MVYNILCNNRSLYHDENYEVINDEKGIKMLSLSTSKSDNVTTIIIDETFMSNMQIYQNIIDVDSKYDFKGFSSQGIFYHGFYIIVNIIVITYALQKLTEIHDSRINELLSIVLVKYKHIMHNVLTLIIDIFQCRIIYYSKYLSGNNSSKF